MLLPAAAAELLDRFGDAFTRPTYERFVLLFVGFIITPWRRTVSRILWTVRWLAEGNASSYHRFFSRAKWSCWKLAHLLAAAVLEWVPSDEPVLLAVDDTVAQHRGKKVFGKGCHRDAVRSSWKTLTRKWGHKWVVLCVLVKFPFATRRWALPVLCCLYRTPQDRKQKPRLRRLGKTRRTKNNNGKGERHKVPAEMARSMVAAMLHWFPRRRFILLGDCGFSTHDLACFACRHGDRLTLIGRMRKDTSLFALPAKHAKVGGRPAKKGDKLPAPAMTVQKAQQNHATRRVKVQWYGNRSREVELVSAAGAWYRPRGNGHSGLAPLRWVFSCDKIGKRQDYFFSTDPAMKAEQIVELFACRWNVEVTFQEARAHLGLETTRQRKKESVLRTAPLMLGAYSCVSLIYARMLEQVTRMREQVRRPLHQTPCYHKSEPTFADALYTLRRELWQQTVMQHLPHGRCFIRLPDPLRNCLLEHLAEAA